MTDTTTTSDLERLLEFLKQSRGFDFTGYKRASLERRIARRMEDVGVKSHADYIDYLEVHPDEYVLLFNTILINVTGFFRDPDTWETLRETTVPELVEQLRDRTTRSASGRRAAPRARRPIRRRWSCATCIGESAYRERVKIYATDVDDEALSTARSGSYPPKSVETVPAAALDRYFERSGPRYAFRKDLRRAIIFGRNDLVQDAPISRIDLMLCRNTLMYFNAETQARILRRLHFALSPHGSLVLGRSEMLITHTDLFTPVSVKRRVFRKVLRPTLRDRLQFMAGPPVGDGAFVDDEVTPLLRDTAFDATPVAQILIDREGRLSQANQQAKRTFGLTHADLGRPVQDLELSYRPVEVRSQLEVARTERRNVGIAGVSWTMAGGETRVFDVQVTPLLNGSEVVGTTVTYLDVTTAHRLQDELRNSKHDLEQAYEELQTTVEELETTNEELQSTNEELETTNEELQSTNEELETTNEELQSTNEELETMNDELRQRTLELNEINAFMETVLTSMGSGGGGARRQAAGAGVEHPRRRSCSALRADEAEGAHWLSLDIGLKVEAMKTPIRAVLRGEEERVELSLEATDRRGRPFTCQLSVLPLTVDSAGPTGVIMLMRRA